jgi:hypothetical protein
MALRWGDFITQVLSYCEFAASFNGKRESSSIAALSAGR